MTAVFLGSTLIFEPKEPGMMQRPPRSPRMALLTKPMVRRILFAGCLLAAMVFIAYNSAAQAGTAFGGLVDYSRLAEKAGFGKIGLHGCLISNKLGPSFRIAIIFTSIDNLPFTDGTNDDEWIWDFCQSCYKCARKCPPDAIYFEPKKNAFGKPIHINYEACASAFTDDYGCGICISGCPFDLMDYQVLFNRFSRQKKRTTPKVIRDLKDNKNGSSVPVMPNY